MPRQYRTLVLPTAATHGRERLHECIVCRTVLKRSARMVHVIDGGSRVLHPDDERLYTSDEGDLYWHAIGEDCARKIGLEWTIKLEKE